MISGAVNTLSSNLMQSMTDYRTQLDTQQPQEDQKTSEAINSDVSLPFDVSGTEPTGSQLTLDGIEVASQEHRDQARKVAAQVFEIQNTQSQVDTYVNGSSDGDDDVSTQPIEPAEPFKDRMKASRREDLFRPEQPVDSLESQPLEVQGAEPTDPAGTPVTPVESQPLFVTESEQPEQTTAEKIEETSQDNRDQARQAAVQTFEIQNAQLQVDTYVNASSDGDNDDVSTQTIDPAEAYKASMKDVRQEALFNTEGVRQEQPVDLIEIESLELPETESIDPAETLANPVESQPSEVPRTEPIYPAGRPVSLVGSQFSEMPGTEPTAEQRDMEELETTSQELRDKSRNAAVQALEIQNTQSMVDTYVNASSDGDNDDVSRLKIDLAKAYEASMQTGRRQSLLRAFEIAAQGVTTGTHFNLII